MPSVRISQKCRPTNAAMASGNRLVCSENSRAATGVLRVKSAAKSFPNTPTSSLPARKCARASYPS